ncbi:hypothetical protein BDQ17DRAFT_944479 [Cyathus striatus]|nr:hypothetical protein BDQ17DRAFT_944479 [Cyathus striatus]
MEMSRIISFINLANMGYLPKQSMDRSYAFNALCCDLDPNFILASVFARSLRFELQDVLQTQGCLPTEGRNDVLIMIWSLLLVYNTGIFKINQPTRLITFNSEVNLGTMLIPAYDYYKYRRQYGRTSNLVQMVLRDGIMHYIYLFGALQAI